MLLARPIAQRQGLRCVSDLLLRRRHTSPQARLNAAARRRNVRDAFALNPHRSALAAGQIVILVDDVMTTGATIEACYRILPEAGAVDIRVLPFARTL